MKDLTVEGVIQFSQKIEQESYQFYKSSSLKLKDPHLNRLTDDLAAAEIDHLNRLRKLLDERRLSREELDQPVQLAEEDYQKIVATTEISDTATPRTILESALLREQNTESTYRMLLTFTNLSEEIIRVFEYLVNQEAGHVKIIRNKLENL